MNTECLTALGEHLSEEKVKSNKAMANGLQHARGAMRRAGGEACDALAPEEPLSLCGNEGEPPQDRSFLRKDLFCEMVAWQWEELGDGDEEEFKEHGCTFQPEMQAKDAEYRKGGALSEQEL